MSTFLIYAVSAPSVETAATISNTTMISSMDGVPGAVSPLSPLLEANITSGNPARNLNGTITSSVSPKITQSYVINALDVKGDPIEVMTGMNCYIIRVAPISRMRREREMDIV